MSIYQKYIYYTACVNNELYDYALPCYEYKCSKCHLYRKYSPVNDNCPLCNNKFEINVCIYEFFNNQVYKRCTHSDNSIYYTLVINNFNCHVSPTFKQENNITLGNYMKSLYKKCMFYCGIDGKLIIESIKKVNENEEIKDENEQKNEVKEEIKQEVKKENKEVKAKKDYKHDKLVKTIAKRLNACKFNQIKIDFSKLEKFLDDYDSPDVTKIFKDFDNVSIFKYITVIDMMFSKWTLFTFDDSVQILLNKDDPEHDIEDFVIFYFEIVSKFAKASEYVSKVRDIVNDYRETSEILEIFSEIQLNDLYSDMKYLNKAIEFNDKMKAIHFSTSEYNSKIKYILKFHNEVLEY